MTGRCYIGVSGWRYEPWRGAFYPEGLRQADELSFASRALPSIEINGSFYSLQRPQDYAHWFEQTPDDFVFGLKGPRYLTHVLRLRDTGQALSNFLASGLFELRHKLGPILWQLPPTMRYDPTLLDAFLQALPRDTEEALAVARRHDERLAGRACLAIDKPRALRHALEVRHASFLDESFVELLRRHRVALVVADTAGRWPLREDVTADFVYMRLHGSQELYRSEYSDAELDHWADRIRTWAGGGQAQDAQRISARPARRRAARDVYCYFDNTDKLKAPFDAKRLLERLRPPDRPKS